MSKLEQIAWAMWADQVKDIRVIGGDFSWEACPSKAAFLSAARAAMEALRDPTNDILQTAQEDLGYEVEFVEGDGNFRFCTNDLREIQGAIIDAILNEKP